MSKVEKTVFISYRRANFFTALAVYQALKAQDYDCFLDYESIDSGSFERIILSQIKARAHFILILTPSALERCAEPGDWLRREIEAAISYKRNIVPLMFEGFDFGDDAIKQRLTGELSPLSSYNAVRVPSDYFKEAMERLMTRFLNVPVDMVLHPLSHEVDTYQQQVAAQPQVSEAFITAEEYMEKGLQYIYNEDFQRAVDVLSEAIALRDDYGRAYSARAGCYIIMGQQAKAQDDLRWVIDVFQPKTAEDYYALGNAYQVQGMAGDAVQAYTRAVELDELFTYAYNNRGIAYHKLRRYADAIADFEQTLRLNPNLEKTQENLEAVRRLKR